MTCPPTSIAQDTIWTAFRTNQNESVHFISYKQTNTMSFYPYCEIHTYINKALLNWAIIGTTNFYFFDNRGEFTKLLRMFVPSFETKMLLNLKVRQLKVSIKVNFTCTILHDNYTDICNLQFLFILVINCV